MMQAARLRMPLRTCSSLPVRIPALRHHEPIVRWWAEVPRKTPWNPPRLEEATWWRRLPMQQCVPPV